MGLFTYLFGSQQEETVAPPRPDAQAMAAAMSQEETSKMISQFGTSTHPFVLSNGEVRGEVKDLVVQWVSVYGIRYGSILEALAARPRLQDEDLIREMQEVHYEFEHARRVMLDLQPRFKKIPTLFDGDVYLYEEGEFPVGRFISANILSTDMGLMIREVYLDGGSGQARYRFDFTKPNELESFKLLVGDNARYKKDMDELLLLMSRLNHHNTLYLQGRLSVIEGQVVIAPPTAEQIRGGRQ